MTVLSASLTDEEIETQKREGTASGHIMCQQQGQHFNRGQSDSNPTPYHGITELFGTQLWEGWGGVLVVSAWVPLRKDDGG